MISKTVAGCEIQPLSFPPGLPEGSHDFERCVCDVARLDRPAEAGWDGIPRVRRGAGAGNTTHIHKQRDVLCLPFLDDTHSLCVCLCAAGGRFGPGGV